MRPVALTPEQESQIDAEASKLRSLMQHEGWPILSRLFLKTVETYDSTHGITTLKELLARRDAIAMMNAWMEAIVGRVDRLNGKENMKKIAAIRRAESGIISVPDDSTRSDEES